jgi:hypothetical protein
MYTAINQSINHQLHIQGHSSSTSLFSSLSSPSLSGLSGIPPVYTAINLSPATVYRATPPAPRSQDSAGSHLCTQHHGDINQSINLINLSIASYIYRATPPAPRSPRPRYQGSAGSHLCTQQSINQTITSYIQYTGRLLQHLALLALTVRTQRDPTYSIMEKKSINQHLSIYILYTG